MGKRLVSEKTEEYLDKDGSVKIRTTEKEYVVKCEQDEFYMVFVNFVRWMYNIKSIGALKLLPRLLSMAEINTGIISLVPGIRASIMEELDMSDSLFAKALKELIDNKALLREYRECTDKETGEIIKKEIRGQYRANPEMFWRGKLRDRRALRAKFDIVDYSEDSVSE